MSSRVAIYLKQARLAAGFETPADAARASGISYQTVVAGENGRTAAGRTPNHRTLLKLAAAYGTTVDALLGRTPPVHSTPDRALPPDVAHLLRAFGAFSGDLADDADRARLRDLMAVARFLLDRHGAA